MSRSERLAEAEILRQDARNLIQKAESLENRETGRTMSKALGYISTLYNNPGVSFLISDHPVDSPNASQARADSCLLSLIKSLVLSMHLQGFSSNGQYMVYSKPTFLKG